MADLFVQGGQRLTKFTHGTNKYDQSSFVGRMKTTFMISDPRSLKYSEAQILQFDQILREHAEGRSTVKYSDDELWHMKTVCDSAIHPQSHGVIGRLWRMSSFAITNMPIVAGFAISPPTFLWTVFWQTANQTYNACFNYANRNTSNDASSGTTHLAKSYLMALGVSVGTAVSLNRLTKTVLVAYPLKMFLQKVVPFIAVASAGMANVALMRSADMMKGLEVTDESGKSYGVSKLAGKKVLGDVMLSRVVLPIPSLLIPPALIFFTRSIRKAMNPKLVLMSDLLLAYMCCSVAMPVAMAVFPNRIRLDASKLEPEFARLVDGNGKAVQYLYADKGL